MNDRPAIRRRCRPCAISLAALICFSFAVAPTLAAQARTTLGLRAGGGTDLKGTTAYVGQVDVTELSGSNSVEVAVHGFSGLRNVDDYTVVESRVYDYHEELRAWGIGLNASYLFRHSPDTVGPYFLGGLGVGPLRVAWRRESRTDPRLDTPLPGGGSFEDEEVWTLGSTLSVGIGQRLHERFDIRAQMIGVLVPSTDLREDLQIVRTFTLTTGVAF